MLIKAMNEGSGDLAKSMKPDNGDLTKPMNSNNGDLINSTKANNGNLTGISFCKWRIAMYCRISKEDKRAGESASIINQRALINDYIKRTDEFSNTFVAEYIDDGLSGSTTDRENYKRMMNDVENGKVNCILVKDLSRIGRNMLETDELLMVYLVERNVRFISLGDNYDSFVHPLSVLELATLNLFNQDYLRDLVEKSNSSRYIKIKRGEHVSGYTNFGYKKSTEDKNKLVIDEEAAGYIRYIFSLTVEGKTSREIAEILNSQNIPTPSVYKTTRHGQGKWHTVDPDYHFWNDNLVWMIQSDERYTGRLISKSYAQPVQGMFKSAKRAKEDWIIVPGAFEAIISDIEYRQARETMNRRRPGILADHIFVTKVRCATCGQIMQRSRKYDPVFKCRTNRFTSHYTCTEQAVPQTDIEQAVLNSLNVYIDVLIEREELKLSTIRKSKEAKIGIENKINAERQAIKQLEESITKMFISLVSNEMTTEAFTSKKEAINHSIAKKKDLVETYEQKLAELNAEKTANECVLENLYAYRDIQKLDRDTVDLLIDRILVHGDKDVEIVWKDRVIPAEEKTVYCN